MKDDKNQMIRSMKSYEVGDATDSSCMEEYTDASGKKKKKRKKGCGSVTKFKTSSGSSGNGGGRNLGLEHLGRKIRWGAKNVARKIKRAF